MAYYIRDMGPNQTAEIWWADDEVVRDVLSPHGVAREFRAQPGGTAWDRMRTDTPWLDGDNPFHRTRLDAGCHNPRIARPLARAHSDWGIWSPSLYTEPAVFAASLGQAHSLLRQLERICQTVQPSVSTFSAYGHDIRNLLVLACMEVETHWRGVLVANGAKRKRFTTRDYVVLAEVMKLGDYAVRFPAFPELEPIRPFAGWGTGPSPTDDLQWYAAYNAVKHNRENEFAQANLKHAFEAMSACAILLKAQFGRWGLGRETDLARFFVFAEVPTWPLSENYFSGLSQPGTPTHALFEAVDHPALAAIQDPPPRGRPPGNLT